MSELTLRKSKAKKKKEKLNEKLNESDVLIEEEV